MMKKSKLLLILTMIILTMMILPKSGISAVSMEAMLMFTAIGFMSIIKLSNEFGRVPYSLHIMHWLFIFFFFFIAPVIQIALDFNPWGVQLSQGETVFVCFLVVLWMLFYEVGNKFGDKINVRIRKKSESINERKENSTFIIIITIIAITCAGIVISNVGLSNLFARSTSVISYEGTNAKMTVLLVSRCSKSAIVYAVAMSIRVFQRTGKHRLLLLVNVVLLLVVCFPSGMARNSAGTIYLGILLILAYKKEKTSRISRYFIYIFIIGFMLVFPAINVFRRMSWSEVNILQVIHNTVDDIASNYASGDYDAFSLIGDVVRYVKANGITHGEQLLGVILFFVPRSIWKTKPYGSGQTVFEWMGANFTNVSCPTLAEGYINFGILGVILFAFFVGSMASIVDKKYWASINKNGFDYDYLTMLYPFLITLFFFMLRGDLMTTWASMASYVVVFWVLDKLQIFVVRL